MHDARVHLVHRRTFLARNRALGAASQSKCPRGVASADSVVVLGGLHSGCYELLGDNDVRTNRGLKGRSVSISSFGATEHVFVASMASYVGLDPRRDIDWKIAESSSEALRMFMEGNADAFLGFAPQPQELRAQKTGHVVVDTTHDRPWSQYFCCMLTGNREFVRDNPVATKRAIRALLKAADTCTARPELAARFMVERGHAPNYAMALEILATLPYRLGRDGNPEDTLRFYALRLYEAGIIQASPQRLIERAADWRFLNDLRKELKA
jgi:NitT/TauT family transport system substrate-binding protein